MNEKIRVELPRLTQAKIKALENVFWAEVEGRMFQSKAKIYARLAEEGYLAAAVQKFPTALGVLTCHGWNMTHSGRFIYCANCGEGEQPATTSEK